MKAYDYEKCPQGIVSTRNETNLNYIFLESYLDNRLVKQKKIRILEIGVGGGRNLQVLKNKYEDKIGLFGTDISKTAITYVNSLKIGLFEVASSEIIPFKGKFDLILLIDLLEHLASKKAVKATLDNTLKKLEKNGCVYISSPIELNKFSLTWFFNKFRLTRNLTYRVFGHSIQFKPETLQGLIDKKLAKVKIQFFSVRTINQFQVLLFLYIPKILLEVVFGKKQAIALRDSNEMMNKDGHSFLSLVKKIIVLLSRPLAYLGYHESYLRRNSKFGAGNIHLLIEKNDKRSI